MARQGEVNNVSVLRRIGIRHLLDPQVKIMRQEIEKIEKRMAEMQDLCIQVENDAEFLRKFNRDFSRIISRYKNLSEFYQKDWLNYLETIQNHPEAERSLDKTVPKGHYSILAQDTIWDALQDIHQEMLKILKKSARNL